MRLYHQDNHIDLWHGDARDMSAFPDGYADLVMTCPPWWDSGDYNHPDQIGFGQVYDDYLGSMTQVWADCYRCLNPGRAIIVWVADLLWRHEPTPLVADMHHTLRQTGFIYEATYHWYEPRKKERPALEEGLPFTCKPKVHAESILIYLKPGEAPHPSAETLQASRIDPDTYRAGQEAVWMPDESLGHPYERLIRLWSYTGDTVLNPFSGQGTIALCARNLQRRCVTVELHEDNCRHIASLLAKGH
jgi:site-specific DNA-methyltransferase (adenine-specific)